MAASRSDVRCSTGTRPPSEATAHASSIAARRSARAARRRASAAATSACTGARSAMLRRLPAGVRRPARATTSSSAPRAIPRLTAPIASASRPNTGNAYSRPPAVGLSTTIDASRSAGTKTSLISMSWLPVPRRPIASQVSWISTSSACASMSRGTGGSSPSTRQPPISQSQCVQPLANGQRPLTR